MQNCNFSIILSLMSIFTYRKSVCVVSKLSPVEDEDWAFTGSHQQLRFILHQRQRQQLSVIHLRLQGGLVK